MTKIIFPLEVVQRPKASASSEMCLSFKEISSSYVVNASSMIAIHLAGTVNPIQLRISLNWSISDVTFVAVVAVVVVAGAVTRTGVETAAVRAIFICLFLLVNNELRL